MIKTFEIDLDDALVQAASDIFETVGSDIDSAVRMFLTQAVLRRGFPFDVTIPEQPGIENETLAQADGLENDTVKVSDNGGEETAVSSVQTDEPENNASGVSDESGLHESEPVLPEQEGQKSPTKNDSPSRSDIDAKVAANEALVAQLRAEVGEKNSVPECNDGEKETATGSGQTVGLEADAAVISAESSAPETEPLPSERESKGVENDESASDAEDEDELPPEHLFDSWDIGDEEEIGCR